METFRKISLIQRNIVLLFYIFFCLALLFPVWLLFVDLKIPGSVTILVIVLMVITFIVIGSYFYLIVCLPERLSRSFDKIRNDIASEKIKTTEEFANHINKFVIKQFNFIFLDVEYTAIGINNTKKIYFNDDFPKDIFDDYNILFTKGAETENVINLGTSKHLDKKNYKYLIPIYFGNKYLGFMIIVTNKKLNNLFKGILSDFENLYVDDQLLHILNYNKNK